MSGDSSDTGDATQSNGPVEADRPPLSKKVRISYASQDAAVANAVVEALERQGIGCWIAPRNVTPGEFYADAIVRAIDAAQALVLVLSKHAAVSHHILREVERASSKRHPVISFRIDRAALPAGLEYFLNTSQWLDASEGEPSRVFPRLGEAVRKALTGGSASGNPQSPPSVPTGDPIWGPQRRSLNRPLTVVLGLVAMGILGCAIDKLWLSRRIVEEKPVVAAVMPAAPVSAPAIPEKSVAVLPFVDMSEKKDQEYFSDGLSEELIDHLARAADLKVIARTSSFQFKGKNEDMRTIGQKLGVANLLEGSVRTSGKTLRVTAQLIKVTDGSHLWSQTYDRAMGDVLAVQDSIAAAVAIALKAAMATQTSSSPYKSNNPEAYAAFLRGRFLLDKNTKDDTDHALAAFEEAARLDPSYAAGWAGIATTYNSYGLNYWMPPMKAYAKAKKAVDCALRLDPNLVWAHEELGAIKGNYLYDYAGQKAENERIRELDQTNDALI